MEHWDLIIMLAIFVGALALWVAADSTLRRPAQDDCQGCTRWAFAPDLREGGK